MTKEEKPCVQIQEDGTNTLRIVFALNCNENGTKEKPMYCYDDSDYDSQETAIGKAALRILKSLKNEGILKFAEVEMLDENKKVKII